MRECIKNYFKEIKNYPNYYNNEKFDTICNEIKKNIDEGIFLVEREEKTDLSVFEKEFGYTPKIGDIIQIGMRVWVTDNNSKKQYDNDTAKTSNAICILNKPISTYLNIIS